MSNTKYCPNCDTRFSGIDCCGNCGGLLVEEYKDESGATCADIDDGKWIMEIPNVEHFSIADGIVGVGECALMDCSQLKELEIPYSFMLSTLETAMEHANRKVKCRLFNWPRKTFISDELQREIEEGTTDSQGLVYSQDGKRLLRATNTYMETYVIPEGVEKIERLAFLGRTFGTLHVPYTCPLYTLPEAERPIFGSERVEGCVVDWNRPYAEADEIEDCIYMLEDADTIWADEYEVRYSQNGKRLISCMMDFDESEYTVPEGVVTICSHAFSAATQFLTLSIPRSVKVIGDNIFGEEGGRIVIR